MIRAGERYISLDRQRFAKQSPEESAAALIESLVAPYYCVGGVMGFVRAIIMGALLISGCSTYSVQQTSLVPSAIVVPTPSATLGSDFALLGSYVTSVRDRASMSDSSLFVSRGQAVGTYEYAFRHASIRGTAFSAPGQGAVRGQPGGLSNPGGTVVGAGPGGVVRLIRDNEHHNLTITGDLWLAIAPSSTQSACVDNCTFALRGGAHRDRSVAFMFTTGLQYRVRPVSFLALTAGAALQTLLTNDEVRPESAFGGRSKVRMGALHPLLDAGIEVYISDWFTLSPMVSFIGPPAPLVYGPTVSLVLRFHGADKKKTASTASGS